MIGWRAAMTLDDLIWVWDRMYTIRQDGRYYVAIYDNTKEVFVAPSIAELHDKVKADYEKRFC